MKSGDIRGLDELNKKLAEMASKMEKQMVEAALLAGAARLADEMKETSAFADQTGHLRKSIGIRIRHKRGVKAAVTVGASAPHSHLLEFGHGGVTKSKAGKVLSWGDGEGFAMSTSSGAKAHPFIRPAYDATKDEVREIIAAALAELAKPGRGG